MSKYNYKVDLTKETSASKIIKLINDNSRVLEIGCASGYMTKILQQEKNCTVDCIEINEVDAAKAQSYCNQILVGDIEEIDFNILKNWGKYDYILFADVLEHLKYPRRILEKCQQLLFNHGQILASVPNMAHSSVVFNLIRGDFNYQNIGLLDNTHLKFYTKKSIIQLFEEAGYFIKIVDRVKIYPQFSEFSIDIDSYPEEIVNYIYRNSSEADTYQFILCSKVLSEENRYEEILKEKNQLEAKISELQQSINHQKDSLKMQINYSEQLESLIHEKDANYKIVEKDLMLKQNNLESQIEYSEKLELLIRTKDEEFKKLENELAAQNEIFNRKSEECTNIQNLYELQLSELKSKEEEIEQLKKKIQNSDLENEVLKGQISNLNLEFKESLKKHDQKIEALVKELEVHKNSNWLKKLRRKM